MRSNWIFFGMYALFLVAVKADYVELPLAEYNRSLNNMTEGGLYGSGGTFYYSDIPLSIADGEGGRHNIWHGWNDNNNTMSIMASVANAGTVYTLINSFWGANNRNIGYVEFFGSGGAYHRYDLIEGQNVRDHLNGSYVNHTHDPSVIDGVFSKGRVRLDMQVIDLPQRFDTETLERISITNTGNTGTGIPFLAAVTVETIPEPASIAYLVITLVGLGSWRKLFL